MLRKTIKKSSVKRKTATRAIARAPFRGYRINIRSRHPSHDGLRQALSALRLPFRTAVRFGSTWAGDGRERIQCNSVEAVKTSANKRLMKRAFNAAGIKHAKWTEWPTIELLEFLTRRQAMEIPSPLEFPIVAKNIYGSRGSGNYLIQTMDDLIRWAEGKQIDNYIFEEFYSYSREYRLHVTKDGCFYTCRKMLKEGTPQQDRWRRHDDNCVWILEENPLFDKPVNWNEIVDHSVRAIAAVGLDVGAVDVKVQSAQTSRGTRRERCEFIILETNSAPSFGEQTLVKYTEQIPRILRQKFANQTF